jgi:hypothetical protein
MPTKMSVLSVVMAGGLASAGVTAAGVTTGHAPAHGVMTARGLLRCG